ncbi:MAG TPA: hypothetical protein VGE52_17605 [Pirellulales bacterium]
MKIAVRNLLQRLLPLAAGLLTVLASPGPAQAIETYCFGLFFGSQSQPRTAKYSHTFCTLVLAQGEGDDVTKYALQTETISWLPATLNVRPLAVHPEKGVNLTLHQSLKYVSEKENIRCWGPHQLQPGAFVAVQRQIALLRSGRVQYQAADAFSGSESVKNCFHAVSDLDQYTGRQAYPLRQFGFQATENIVDTLDSRGRFLSRNHDWLVGRLGLRCYDIEYVEYNRCEKESYPRKLNCCCVPPLVKLPAVPAGPAADGCTLAPNACTALIDSCTAVAGSCTTAAASCGAPVEIEAPMGEVHIVQ